MLPGFKIIPRVSEGVISPACNGISATREVQTPVWVICETWQQGGLSQGAKWSQLCCEQQQRLDKGSIKLTPNCLWGDIWLGGRKCEG